jgi:hypothetical protein
MANKKLTVKLNPISTLVKSPKGNFKIVSGATVSIENGANGASLATDADQDAVIEFFETGDQATPLFTLMSTLKLDSGVPKFNIAAARTITRLSDADTDFNIRLEFSPVNFPTGNPQTFTLRLPYAVRNLNLAAPSVGNLTVGAHLRLGGTNDIFAGKIVTPGTIESPAFKDKLDIPMLQREAADADDPSAKHVLIGPASSGHPLTLAFNSQNQLARGQTIPKAGTTFEIIFHNSLRLHCNSLTQAPTDAFSLPQLQGFMAAMLATVGFTGIAFSEVQTDAAFAKLWLPNNKTRLVSTTVPNPDAIDVSVTNGSGHIVPFFQYTISAAPGQTPAGDELAFSELLETVQGAAKTKRITSPITVAGGGRNNPFNTTYSAQTGTAARMTFLANVLVHEIGHCLGLSHAHTFNPGNSTHELSGTVTMMSGKLRTDVGLRKFGPVHTALLQQTYP